MSLIDCVAHSMISIIYVELHISYLKGFRVAESSGQTGRMVVVVVMIVAVVSVGFLAFYTDPSQGDVTTPSPLPGLTLPNITLPNITQSLHEPIRITSDEEFHNTSVTEEWIGNGTVDYPFIIEDYHIIADMSCIYIRNVTVSFMVRDCFFEGEKQLYTKGLYVEDASNVFVYDCFFYQLDEGIAFMFTSDSNATHCSFLEVNTGVNVTLSVDIGFYGCAMSGGHGAWDYSGGTIQVERGGAGIFIAGSNSTVVDYCNASRYYWGLLAQSSVNCSITGNTLANNIDGFEMDWRCNNWVISDNTIVHNLVGISIGTECSNCQIMWNRIGWNNESNAIDYGTMNVWDDGIDRGNAWSDYMGTGEYQISGTAESFDRYPSVLTW